MALKFWPFNRKKNNDTLPEEAKVPTEVKEYYESGRKQKTGMAWLLALGTLLVTVVLAMLLFFGGRWVYQQLAGDDQPAQQPTAQEADLQSDNVQPDQPDNTNSETNQTANDAEQDSQDSDSEQSTQGAAGQSSTPGTGTTGTEIPNTGPGAGGLQ